MHNRVPALTLALLLSTGCASYQEPPETAPNVSEIRTGQWRIHAVDGQSVGFFYPNELRVLPGAHTFELKPSLAQNEVRGVIHPTLEVEANSIYEAETPPDWSSIEFRRTGSYR